MRRATLVCALAACAPEPAPPAQSDAAVAPDASLAIELVTTSGWVALDAASDPWAAHRDPARPCDPFALRDEGAFFEIDTRICGAITVRQPIARAIRAGDRLSAVIWHLGLTADPPATGHVALTIGGHAILDETVPIPSEARVFELDLPAGFDAALAAPAELHVHNHGANNWRIAYLRLTPR